MNHFKEAILQNIMEKDNVESLQIELWYQKYIADRYFGK